MTVWLMGSMVNVNEAVNWHLGCWPSHAVQEEGALDHSPAHLHQCGVSP